MNSTAFIELLSQDNPADFRGSEQLDKLLSKHPYFQIGLAAKSRFLKANQHIDYLKTARKAAILFPDRSKLQDFLNKKTKSTSISKKTIEVENKNNEIAKKEVVTQEPVISTEDTFIKNDELERNYLAEAVNYSIQQEASEIEVESTVETKQPEVEKDEVLSFSDWLYGSDNKPLKVSQSKLIDNFISEEPIISKVNKNDFYSPTEKGRESLSESNLPVSETLAQIFIDQGNNLLAIESYKKLMLKYPEKSVYFAGLIKNLKE